MEISSDRRTVHQCLEQRFSLPSYQREYKWELKHFQELLQDILDAFFANYLPEHGRSAVAKYERYFLGTIITTPASDGQRTIVDGQQRITTLAIIVAYFARMAKQEPALGISDIASLLRRNVFGQNEFNISFDASRKQLFELLLESNDEDSEDETLDSLVDSIPNLDSGSRRLYELFCHTHNLIGKLEPTQVPFFVDYLTQCVVLFEISVPGEQDGHKVFVTMNDRGLKLSPIDLLKGYLLSSIPDDSENVAAHQTWKECLSKLTNIGSDEDSTFFKTWLRSQYGDSIRGKQKGAAPGDFEIIGDSYHRWVVDNREKLGLQSSDDFYNLLTTTLPLYVGHYTQIKNAEKKLVQSYPNVFYNGSRDLTLQSMLMLAAISPSDTQSEASKKIKLVSYFLDCFATHRLVKRQDNTYNNLRDPLFELSKQIRRKSTKELGEILNKKLLESTDNQPIKISEMKYHYHDASDILHALARVADYLENEFEATNKVGFESYVQRGKGNKTFDIEHVLSTNIASVKLDLGADWDFPNDTDYARDRNSLGALILLSRGRNRSLKDSPYSYKLGVYTSESILAQTLTSSFYSNNPKVSQKVEELELKLEAYGKFNLETLRKRNSAYDQIAEFIWNPSYLLASAS
ncbi:uncharacterized protein DUF1524 [Pseudoduganella lurida]|uniref:Uncharacterized protein DUF1524 n=1 Tax=Pseudoduganella lurida TaxID=1036180 RepID=A0A562RLN6_9BURK|nr:DUF262 domain-containing protein [Pseudoduganella lurida]TWI69957.1 uncharacterized protein DUF1524 [Pseudoduganella lurida]